MAQLSRQSLRLNCQGSISASCSSASSSGRRNFYKSAIRQSAEPDPTSLTPSTQQSLTSQDQGQHNNAVNSSSSSPRRGSNILPPYPVWRKSVGKSFENPPPGSKGPFWIGDTPFPLNPSFNPPAPVAHSTKQDIWQLHSTDPQKNHVRKLSTQFGIPAERVVAILRLMALEKEFKQQGKALQTPFQRQMEKLLGSEASRSSSVQRELDALNTKASGSMAGQIFEEFGMGSKDSEEKSLFAPALRKEADERRERIRKMGTGGPASKGAQLSSIHIESDLTKKKSSITFVDMSSRPTSYSGAGRLQRNIKRADQRKANRDKRRALDKNWTLRTELAKKIEQGDRSPEILAQKVKLDAEKVIADQQKQVEWRKKYKSNRKRKMAMKILNGQAPKPRRK